MISEWNLIWLYWLGAVVVTFCVLEGYAIYRDGGKMDLTLSDTIRRWHVAWRPLSAVVSGFAVLLLVHFFGN